MADETHEACAGCGVGRLHPRVTRDTVEYKGQTTEMDLHYYLCDNCGSEIGTLEHVNQNAKLMTIFCKKVDGLLSGAEIRIIRERLGLSQEEAARIFKGDPIPFHKYEEDRKPHSEETDKLLRQAAANPQAFLQTRDRLAAVPA